MVATRYLTAKYDYYEQPKNPSEDYIQQFDNRTNTSIVLAIDRIYANERYWKLPIIVLVFEHESFLKELQDYGTSRKN